MGLLQATQNRLPHGAITRISQGRVRAPQSASLYLKSVLGRQRDQDENSSQPVAPAPNMLQPLLVPAILFSSRYCAPAAIVIQQRRGHSVEEGSIILDDEFVRQVHLECLGQFIEGLLLSALCRLLPSTTSPRSNSSSRR